MPFSAVRFARFLRAFYPLIRAFLFCLQCPLVRAFLFRFERYFYKLLPLAPPYFCLFCIIRSFMSVPSDLILFHPARRFIALKQFSAFCQSSDVSSVICFFAHEKTDLFSADLFPVQTTVEIHTNTQTHTSVRAIATKPFSAMLSSSAPLGSAANTTPGRSGRKYRPCMP